MRKEGNWATLAKVKSRIHAPPLSAVHRQVKQLLVEWHIFPNDPPIGTFRRLQKVLDDLKAAGFLLFKKEKGALSVKRVGNDFRFSLSQYHLQQHACYINTNFQQP